MEAIQRGGDMQIQMKLWQRLAVFLTMIATGAAVAHAQAPPPPPSYPPQQLARLVRRVAISITT